jgi:protein-disulfide isomerase
VASRTAQKQQARERRLTEERGLAERARRERRLRMLGGMVLLVAAVVAVAIAVSSGGSKTVKPGSAAARADAASVTNLLADIPQSGTTLGDPNAKVTVTEFGDLECPVCRDFALGAEAQLISNDVKSGKVKLVYRSDETASAGSPIPNVFPTQQIAAYAAGKQAKAWNYILLFYKEQGQEDTGYATEAYLDGLAQQVQGLDVATWKADRKDPSLASQFSSDVSSAKAKGYGSTPTIVVQGPKGTAQPLVGDYPYSDVESAIQSVS